MTHPAHRAKAIAICFRDRKDGLAAVEFALIAPVLILFLVLSLHFAFAFYVKLRIVAATNAAAEYVFQQGAAISASDFADFVLKIQSIAEITAGLGPATTVTVLYNNASDPSNLDSFYCVEGSKSLIWRSTGLLIAPCANSLQSGKFVTLTVDAQALGLFQATAMVGRIINLTETAIVRVQ